MQTQTETITKPVTFDEFAAWYPENSVKRYELHNGVIVEMPLGTGRHSPCYSFYTGRNQRRNQATEIALLYPR